MENVKKSKIVDVGITYSSLWGHALQATNFSRVIEHCFDIPVKPEKKDDGFFEVTVNGESVFKVEGGCDPDRSPEFLIEILQNYKDLVRPAEVLSTQPDNNDPKYRAWMRSVCSGE